MTQYNSEQVFRPRTVGSVPVLRNARWWFAGALLLGLVSCGKGTSPVCSETRELMGTLVSVTVRHPDPRGAREGLEAAFAAMVAVDESMSTWKQESEISRLNRNGEVEAGSDFLTVLRGALETHRISGGAFDPTMLPLLEVQRQSFADHDGPPSPAAVRALLPRVDARTIRIEGSRVTLPPGVRVTLDGIAKGYAIDRAIDALVAHGVRHALVDAGGDVRAMGDRGDRPWQVAMQDPRDASRHLARFPLHDRAVATSGDYRRYFDPAMRHHHLLDPRTGESAEELISASVSAPTAMQADALATAVFVLGVKEGLALVEGLGAVEAFVVTEERETFASSGW